MQHGHVLRREFEYIRHGTLSWFINLDVVSGHVIEPSWGPTHNEEDALAHLQRLIASDPQATKWHVILDNLNIHQSESLVRLSSLSAKGSQPRRMPRQGQKRHLALDGKPGRLLARPHPPSGVVLHAQARFLDEPGRNLAQYFDAQVAQAGQFPLAGRLARPNLGLHRLLQSHHGQTHQVDIYRTHLIAGIFLLQCTGVMTEFHALTGWRPLALWPDF